MWKNHAHDLARSIKMRDNGGRTRVASMVGTRRRSMAEIPDTNAAIWKSDDVIKEWAASAGRHERDRLDH
jgi:hypothetical protein